jgi:hypothetical protein
MPLPDNFRISSEYVELGIVDGPTLRQIIVCTINRWPNQFTAEFTDTKDRVNFYCPIPKGKITRNVILVQGTIDDTGGVLYFELLYYPSKHLGALRIHNVERWPSIH